MTCMSTAANRARSESPCARACGYRFPFVFEAPKLGIEGHIETGISAKVDALSTHGLIVHLLTSGSLMKFPCMPSFVAFLVGKKIAGIYVEIF